MRWEYDVHSMELNAIKVKHFLRGQGECGWELVSFEIEPGRPSGSNIAWLTFKRPARDQQT